MQVEHVQLIEGLHQRLSHAPKRGVVQKGMVGDDAHHAFLHLFHLLLGEADELDVVVLQPLEVSFTQRLAVHGLIGVDLLRDPGAGVLGVAGVGRVAGNDQDGTVLDVLRGFDFPRQGGQEPVGLRRDGFQGVRQVDAQPLVGLHRVTPVVQELRQLQMGDRVGRNQILEAVQVLQNVFSHDVAADARRDRLEYLLQHFQEKRARAGGEVQHGHPLAVGQPLTDAEGVFQDVVHRPDDEVHHRRRGVIHAARLAGFPVVGFQKVLVEIDVRVFGEQQPIFFGRGEQPRL